jgi:hypothetical protein
MSMKNSDDTIGNGTRGLPVCSAVPEPTAPPRAPNVTARQHFFPIPPFHVIQTNIIFYLFLLSLASAMHSMPDGRTNGHC